MEPKWTPELDRVIETIMLRGGRLNDAGRAVALETRGEFTPHSKTVQRRLWRLGWKYDRIADAWAHRLAAIWPSTRVDTSAIKPRVRVRPEHPPLVVLSIPAMSVDEDRTVTDAVGKLLLATLPGWTWRVADLDATREDAIACAQHQARLRGDSFVVLESEPSQPAFVAIRPAGATRSIFVSLVPVYFERRSG